jgi:hypothetical protein
VGLFAVRTTPDLTAAILDDTLVSDISNVLLEMGLIKAAEQQACLFETDAINAKTADELFQMEKFTGQSVLWVSVFSSMR